MPPIKPSNDISIARTINAKINDATITTKVELCNEEKEGHETFSTSSLYESLMYPIFLSFQSKSLVLPDEAIFSHLSGFSTLPRGRLLQHHRACPSVALDKNIYFSYLTMHYIIFAR